MKMALKDCPIQINWTVRIAMVSLHQLDIFAIFPGFGEIFFSTSEGDVTLVDPYYQLTKALLRVHTTKLYFPSKSRHRGQSLTASSLEHHSLTNVPCQWFATCDLLIVPALSSSYKKKKKTFFLCVENLHAFFLAGKSVNMNFQGSNREWGTYKVTMTPPGLFYP